MKQHSMKMEVLKLHFEDKKSSKVIAKELNLKLSYVRNVITREINNRMFTEVKQEGIYFGTKNTSYYEETPELNCYSGYLPKFSEETLSHSEKCIQINPEHLVNFKQQIELLNHGRV